MHLQLADRVDIVPTIICVHRIHKCLHATNDNIVNFPGVILVVVVWLPETESNGNTTGCSWNRNGNVLIRVDGSWDHGVVCMSKKTQN